jgi:hypothetical protein
MNLVLLERLKLKFIDAINVNIAIVTQRNSYIKNIVSGLLIIRKNKNVAYVVFLIIEFLIFTIVLKIKSLVWVIFYLTDMGLIV